MVTYIALLRGINVGGKNKVKMEALRQMCEQLGLNHVQTYIQSGNVLFQSNEPETVLRKQIEHGFEQTFGFSVIIVLRTVEELIKIAQNCPFSQGEIDEAEAASEAESLYVALLSEAPPEANVEKVLSYRSKCDQFQLDGRNVYLLFHHSIRDSKLANHLPKLGVPVTIRNWKTMTKLIELARART